VTIPRTTAECKTLTEQRDFILRESQSHVGARANTTQARISQIENGLMPQAKFWMQLAEAYKVTEAEFIRLLEGSIKHSSGGENDGNTGTANTAGSVPSTGAVA
jgi:hypothetical protein